MKTKSPNKPSGGRSYIFGSFAVQQDRERQTNKVRINPSRLLLVGAVVMLTLYCSVVAAGYIWLKQFRKLEKITVVDVALLRWKQVRRNISTQQFEQARGDWREEKYQSAYLAFFSAIRNDPANISGRLEAADFLISAGATTQAVTILKDGLERDPQNLQLLEKMLDLLTGTAREKDALALIRSALGAAGPNAAMLHTYEVLAVLNAEGVGAARGLLEKYPDVRGRVLSGLVTGRVLWETKERLAAIDALSAYIKAKPSDYAGYALLAQYQEAAGMNVDAQATADLACINIPDEIGPRILRIGTLSPSSPMEFERWRAEIGSYLTAFRNKPQAFEFLADVAGRKGWVALARSLYEVGLMRPVNVRMLAVYYADALARNQQWKEARQVLAEVELQTPDEGPFTVLLRQRQIVAAAESGDHDAARDGARRLANSLRQEPDKLETCRRRFEHLGVPEAAAEFSSALSNLRVASRK